MLGQLAPEDVARLYRNSDVLLFPVRWDEPWGLVPLEAMACGCPVIATGQGGSAEYLHDGENCLLVPAADPTALAAGITRLAASGALREALWDGGVQTASRYTEEAFNRSVEGHLEEVASSARATSPAGLTAPGQRVRRDGGPSPGGPKYSSTRAGTPPTSV
jgi:glycosyltransferase involved in cell wall biosynthesis